MGGLQSLSAFQPPKKSYTEQHIIIYIGSATCGRPVMTLYGWKMGLQRLLLEQDGRNRTDDTSQGVVSPQRRHHHQRALAHLGIPSLGDGGP